MSIAARTNTICEKICGRQIADGELTMKIRTRMTQEEKQEPPSFYYAQATA